MLGTTNLRKLVQGDPRATNRLTPQSAIRETASFMSMHGYCGHARSGALAVTRLFKLWEGEILEHLRTKKGLAGARERDPFATDSAERRALDTFLTTV